MKIRGKIKELGNMFRDKRFLLKLLLSFGILLTGFSILIKIFFVRLDNIAQQDAVEECTERFIRNSDELENTLEDIYLNGIILLQDDVVSSTIKDYDALSVHDHLKLPNIISMLSGITAKEENVSHCYLFIDDKKVYTESGIYDADLYFENYHRYDSFDIEAWTAARTAAETLSIMPATSLNTATRVTQVIPMAIVRLWNRMVFVQDIEVSGLGETLSAYSKAYQSFWITCNNEVVYQSKDTGETLAYYLEGNNSDQDEFCLLTQNISYNIALYCVIDYAGLNWHISEKYRNLTMLFSAFMVALSIIIIALCVQLYNPVRQLKKVVMEENNINRHTGEFQNITSEIQNMRMNWKTAETKLNQALNSYISTRLELIVFYNRYPATGKEQSKLLNSLGFQNKDMCCVAIEIIGEGTNHNPLFNFDEHQKYLFEETVDYLLENLLRNQINAYVISRNYLSYIVIIGEDDLSQDKLRLSFQKIADIFKYDYAFWKIKVGVGPNVKSIREIQKSYHYAETAAYLCSSDAKYQVLFAEADKISGNANIEKYELDQIQNMIKSGNVEALNAKLNYWKEELTKRKILIQEQRHFWHSVYQRVYKILEEEALSFFEITGIEKEYFDYGLSGATGRINDYTDKVCKICHNGSVYFEAKSMNMKERIAEILTYIQNHYSESIGLGEIADKFNISSHYLSRVFKECININISDYIARYRIQIAEQLLLSTDEPIQDITEKVGIVSRATFLRLFKSIIGISPTEYRKINRK